MGRGRQTVVYTVFLEEMRIMQRSVKDTVAAVAVRNGLTPVQSRVLNVLRAHDGEPTKEVARRLCIAPPDLTPALRELAEAGYVRCCGQGQDECQHNEEG